jgi:hypothetical protein
MIAKIIIIIMQNIRQPVTEFPMKTSYIFNLEKLSTEPAYYELFLKINLKKNTVLTIIIDNHSKIELLSKIKEKHNLGIYRLTSSSKVHLKHFKEKIINCTLLLHELEKVDILTKKLADHKEFLKNNENTITQIKTNLGTFNIKINTSIAIPNTFISSNRIIQNFHKIEIFHLHATKQRKIII